jgi:hypothetical protein
MAAERQRRVEQVLTCATLRDPAAIDLDRAADADGDEKPSEGASEGARMQADVARDIAILLSEESEPRPALGMPGIRDKGGYDG